MKKIENFLSGTINLKDKLAPSYIDNSNPKYIEIDNRYERR